MINLTKIFIAYTIASEEVVDVVMMGCNERI